MNESNILTLILNALGRTNHIRVFRNNSGCLMDRNGQYVRYGVPPTGGGSDAIGWTSIVIGPEHLSRRLAIFTAVEVKTTKGRATGKQSAFINAVHAAGGFAGVARTVEEAQEICRQLEGAPPPEAGL